MGIALDARDRRILALAVPALGSLAIEPLYLIVDTAIVGHLGKTALGGLAVASSVLGVAFWVFHFLLEGVTTQVAQRVGARDSAGAGQVVVRAMTVALLIGTVVAVVLVLGTGPVVGLFGGAGGVRRAAVTYTRISALSPPFIFVSMVGMGYLRGVEDTKATVPVILTANVLNVVLELALVGPLHQGIAGSAWGTVFAQAIAAGWFVSIVARRLPGIRWRPTLVGARALVRIGGQLFVRTALLITMFSFATRVAARIGDATLGAHQIAYQLFMFLALSTDALAVAGQTLAGTLIGAADRAELHAVTRRITRMSLVVGAVLTVIVAALAPLVPRVFTSDRAVIHQATIALLFLAVMQIPGALAFQWDGLLMGADDFGYLASAMGVTFVFCMPLLFAVQAHRGAGIALLWTVLVLMVGVRAALSMWRGRTDAWMVGPAIAK